MVVEVARKTFDAIIFYGDYYNLMVPTKALQNLYQKHKNESPIQLKNSLRCWVNIKMKPDKTKISDIPDTELDNIHSHSRKELAYAIEKFFEDSVCEWDIIRTSEENKILKSYAMKKESEENFEDMEEAE